MKATGVMKTESATTKAGKSYMKVTVGDTHLYDWNGAVKKSGLEDGMTVEADYVDGEYKKLKTIVPTTVSLQAKVGEELNQHQTEAVQAPQRENPSSSATYLQLKLAVELFDKMVMKTDDEGHGCEWSDQLQGLENIYKKIKGLWEDG